MNLVVKSAAVFLFVVAAVGGLSIWILKRPAGVAGKWEPLQWAVPQVVASDGGSGSSFVTEIMGKLLLVTNYHVLDGNSEAKAIFRDPPSGKPQFEVSLKTAEAMVHHEFIPSWDSDDSGAKYDLAVFDIDLWRPQIEALGIEPLSIAESGSLHVGDAVAGLGHPGSSFGGGDTKDRESAGIATHSLVGGRISAVRTEAGKPRRVQTDAEIAHGYSGGPLVLEDSGKVAAVNTWGEVRRGQSVAGMSFSLAADHVNTIVEQGVLLSSIHDRIVASGKKELSTGEELPEKQWSRWEWLEGAFEARSSEGWQWGDRAIRKTNSSGLDEMTWKVPGEGPQHVAVLILPESPLVDLDVERLGSSAGEAGKDEESWAGGFTFLPFHDAKSGQLLAFAPGETVTAAVSAWFLGEPIEARYLILWMHLPAQGGGGTSGGGSSGGGSPPPQPPPQPPPGSGTAPQPAAAPPGGWANAVTVQALVEPKIYASSLIGLREFDKRYLEGTDLDGAIDTLCEIFLPDTWEPIEGNPEFFALIKRVSIVTGLESLFDQRPLVKLVLSASARGAPVGVYLEVDEQYRNLLSVAGEGLVTSRADIVIEAGQEGIFEFRGGELVLPISLPWKDAGLLQLDQSTEIPMVLKVKFGDGTSESVAIRPRIIPHDQVQFGYPLEFGVATLVDESHPWIRRIIDEVNQQAMVKDSGLEITGRGGGMDQQLISIFLIWRDLMSRGLRYQSMTAAEGAAQRCRTIHESLSTANANCLDGAILLASFVKAMGIPVDIVLTPTHAFVCAQISGRREDGTVDTFPCFIETTVLGKTVQENPKSIHLSDDYFDRLRRDHPLLRCAEFNCFELACDAGWDALQEAVKQASPAVAAVDAMFPERGKRANDPEWKEQWERALVDLSNQVKLLSVSGARFVGVLPVGHPPDLDTKFKFPQRR